ncbi:MAG: peptidase dimerization domain-containing protein [Desulfobacteraceae bacterium]|nr:peptidase dimerization domain-containing protein [Desulfobacteraceae bacterium]MBC2754952.1 peptidase dimerization domain-containing protein [Desulfobacteraceae bacterium]
MENILKKLPAFVDQIREIQEVIISNIVLIGQTPAPTNHEEARTEIFLERLSDAQADYCATDDYNIPIGIIKGTSAESRPPIFVVAHLDTFFNADIDHNFIIREDSITGPGILDNSASAGVLASLPVIFRKLDLKFESDIVLAGVPQSIGKGNLQGIRHLLDTWKGPIRGAVIVEGEQLGRLNYYSEGIIRGEITCNVSSTNGWEHRYKPNAILILHKVIDEILAMELPQQPRARVIIGKINGGFKHGVIAYNARLGFEIQSDSNNMVKRMHAEIKDIVNGIAHETHISIKLNIISNLTPTKLKYKHPLVKSAVSVMKKLGLQPASDSSESELSIFLVRKIPAVTLGVTEGTNVHLENASMKIKPMFTGIAQIIGVIMAIDSGVCDES